MKTCILFFLLCFIGGIYGQCCTNSTSSFSWSSSDPSTYSVPSIAAPGVYHMILRRSDGSSCPFSVYLSVQVGNAYFAQGNTASVGCSVSNSYTSSSNDISISNVDYANSNTFKLRI